MNKRDNDFFDIYKKLNSLIEEMFSCSEGVSDYISFMDSMRSRGRRLVYTWDQDFQVLKRLRFIRNKIAHEADVEYCTNDDLYLLKLYYDRFLAGDDPINNLLKAESAERKVREKKAKKAAKKSTNPKRKASVAPTVKAAHKKTSTQKSSSTRRKTGKKKKANTKFIVCLALIALIFVVILITVLFIKSML